MIKNRKTIDAVGGCTKYRNTVESAKVLIAVFLDDDAAYDRTKDAQAIGACMENMLLAVHSLKLGACWLGEILKQKEKVAQILDVPTSFELMAVLAVGYPQKRERASNRRPLDELIFKWVR